jgi:hypothetical protein
MLPISTERVEWIDERLRVLKAMFKELSRQRHMYGARPVEIQAMVESVQRERTLLLLEHEVITKALAARVESKDE